MQLAHVIPSPCISRVVRIITEILLTSPPNRTLFDSMNGVSALTSLFMLFDASCITHELFIAVNDFCESCARSSWSRSSSTGTFGERATPR